MNVDINTFNTVYYTALSLAYVLYSSWFLFVFLSFYMKF